MPPHRVFLVFLRRFGMKTPVHFAHFGLGSGMVLEGTTGVYEPTTFPGFSPTRPTELRRAGGREPWERGCVWTWFIAQFKISKKEREMCEFEIADLKNFLFALYSN